MNTWNPRSSTTNNDKAHITHPHNGNLQHKCSKLFGFIPRGQLQNRACMFVCGDWVLLSTQTNKQTHTPPTSHLPFPSSQCQPCRLFSNRHLSLLFSPPSIVYVQTSATILTCTHTHTYHNHIIFGQGSIDNDDVSWPHIDRAPALQSWLPIIIIISCVVLLAVMVLDFPTPISFAWPTPNTITNRKNPKKRHPIKKKKSFQQSSLFQFPPSNPLCSF